MKRVVLLITLSIVTVAALSCKRAPAQKPVELATTKTVEYVTDEAMVIDEASRKQLETTLAALKARKHMDFAVVTVKTVGDQTPYDYSLFLARERKKNSSEQNVSGLLLLVSVDTRQWHLQISRNLEAALTNELLKSLSPPM